MKKRMNRKGQLTAFIIIAVVIAAVLIFILYPRIKIYVAPVTPSGFIQDCVDKEVDNGVKLLASQGGSLNPENAIFYGDNKVEYLCFTNEYYKTCKMQQPLLKQHFEAELASYLKPKVQQCINSLASEYEKKGYTVSVKTAEVSVSLIPHSVKIVVNAPITLSKETTESYEKFNIAGRSEMYDLIMISTSILNYEARYGDSAPETFMMYYPNLKVEKLKQEDGSKIYVLTHRETSERFIFASRSLSWPAGYEFSEVYVK